MNLRKRSNHIANIETSENRIMRTTELVQLLKNTQVIWIDIDGTLSDTISAALAEVRSRYGNILEFSDWKTWNPHQIPRLQNQWLTTIEDTIQLFYSILRDGWDQIVQPIIGSIKWVKRLQSLWKELIALSGRIEKSRTYTTGWIDQYYPWVFQKILLTDHDTPKQVEKYELAQQHGISIMIEDNALYAIDLATHGIPTILLEAPWNIDVDTSTYPNIYRVKDWNEILEMLK